MEKRNILPDEDIFERISSVIVDKLIIDKNNVVPTARFVNDLGADSLDLLDLMMGVEKEFSIKIEDDEVGNITTVQDLVDLIKTKI